MINFKLVEAEGLMNALHTIVQEKLPFKISYQMNKIMKEVVKKFNEFNNKRFSLCMKYTEKTLDGQPVIIDNQYHIKPENKEVFNEEFKELANTDISIDLWKIKLSELMKCDIQVSPQDLLVLDKIIEEEDG